MKKLIVPIRKINGKISNRIDDEFSNVKNVGTIKLTSRFLKKINSSRMFKIKTIQRKKILMLKIFFKKIEIIFFL
tara:strand:+ start:450 stop:674 length:225 start_codon:yes stop_codon:yes gene_type:complete